MSLKSTILWLCVAGGLFSFIYFYQRHAHPPEAGPGKVFPELRAQAVTSILVRPSGPVQLQIRADRTNGVWLLTQPLPYAAQPELVQKLLAFLEQLKPATYITGSELRKHPNADEEYGFASPQATLVIQQGPYAPRVRVGALTNPGDEVYLQVEGDLGAYLVGAELLNYLPRSANDWRNTTLFSLDNPAFDRVAVTNNAKGDTGRAGLPASSSTFVLQRDPTNRLWKMIWPLDARANRRRIDDSLRKLKELRIVQFVSDDPKADLDSFGLSPAELELGFTSGTNALGLFQFGRCPTNDISHVYARRAGQNGIYLVDKDSLLGWCGVLNDFRDPLLLSPADGVTTVEVTHGEEHSSVERQKDGSWRVVPEGYTADPELIANLLSTLTNLQIIKFVNDVVNSADLPQYGLAPPSYRLLLKSTSSLPGMTNLAITAGVDFGLGTNAQDKVYAKRNDESFVYAVSTNDFVRLPSATWLLRDRKLCPSLETNVTTVTLRQGEKVCRLIHKGPLSWSFAPGSQGIINDGAIEETIRAVIQTAAICWVARGEPSRLAYGLGNNSYHLGIEFKNGDKFELEFGGEAPTGDVYACIMLGGQPWIMQYPWMIYRDIAAYLPLRPN